MTSVTPQDRKADAFCMRTSSVSILFFTSPQLTKTKIEIIEIIFNSIRISQNSSPCFLVISPYAFFIYIFFINKTNRFDE